MVDNNFTDKEIVNGDDDVNFFDSHNNAADDAGNANDGPYSKGASVTKKKRKKGATTKTGGKQVTKHNKTRQHKKHHNQL